MSRVFSPLHHRRRMLQPVHLSAHAYSVQVNHLNPTAVCVEQYVPAGIIPMPDTMLVQRSRETTYRLQYGLPVWEIGRTD